jgi:GH24 family phage-related lysozyme (muramidase)
MTKNKYIISDNIRDFIISTTKLNLTPNNGVIGYNHLIPNGASQKAITSDIAYYLLLSDLHEITKDLNQYLEINLPENKLCALVSYLHSNHFTSNPLILSDINRGDFKLAAQRLFFQKTNNRALRNIELRVWNGEMDYMKTINLSQNIG